MRDLTLPIPQIDKRPAVPTGRPGRSGHLVDPFGRQISYLRLSVTDRCDLRCTYCMAEKMTFLPKKELLTLEELDRLATTFIASGVDKLRITGGEPLVRKDIMALFRSLGRHLETGALRELTLTTNATQLEKYAEDLARAGVRRINVSLDSLDPEVFTRITRGGDLGQVIAGIDAALAAGLNVKLNTVALKHDNAHDIAGMMVWAHERGMDFTLIEAMPMGEIDADRYDQYIPVSQIRETLEQRFTLHPLAERTGGPARYVKVKETGGRLGLITPLSQNFCDGCNRVRVTCTGQLYMCLGQNDSGDLRRVLRDNPADDAPLRAAIEEAIGRKPKGHDFAIDRRQAPAAVSRHMSVTGG